MGEQEGGIGATYVSNFNVPPIVQLTADGGAPGNVRNFSAFFSPSGPIVLYRAVPLFLDASKTTDTDNYPIEFTWTVNNSNPNVTITPSVSGSSAVLLINRAIGGAAITDPPIIVGVVAVDYNGVTPLHPPMTITHISVTGNVVTVTTAEPVSLAEGELVFLYDIDVATFLNDRVVSVVSAASGVVFSANLTSGFTHADYASAPDTGFAIANFQYGYCVVTVPYNAPPTIDFSHDGISHEPVILPIQAPRNTTVDINPTYTGVTDPDDATTYSWSQTGGNLIPISQILNGLHNPYLQFQDNGALLTGEALTWDLTVNDGVNPPATGNVEVDVVTYPFAYLDTLRLSRTIWGYPSSPPTSPIITSPPTSPPVTSPPTSPPTIADIALRNTPQVYSTLDVSTLYTNFRSVKRNSVLDGTDRYLIISEASVMVYGGVNPNMVLLPQIVCSTVSDCRCCSH